MASPRQPSFKGPPAASRSKRCPRCKEVKDIDTGFGWKKDVRYKDGRAPQAWCRQCKNNYGHPTREGRPLVREDLPKPFDLNMRQFLASEPGMRAQYENFRERVLRMMLAKASTGNDPLPS